MPNSELQEIQNIVAQCSSFNNQYITFIEVSKDLYIYLRNQLKDSFIYNKEKDKWPQTLYNCPVVISPDLKNFEYKIVRKERAYE